MNILKKPFLSAIAIKWFELTMIRKVLNHHKPFNGIIKSLLLIYLYIVNKIGMLCNIDCAVYYPATVNEPPNLKYASHGYSLIKMYIMELRVALLSNDYIIVDFKLMIFKGIIQ